MPAARSTSQDRLIYFYLTLILRLLSKMKIPFQTFDVFTDTRYAGNPLAIVFLNSVSTTLSQTQKQAIAREFNLSETVFLHESSPDATTMTVDIFTSVAEIPFAGHPTIGTAFYLLQHLKPLILPTELLTKAGPIPISSIPSVPHVAASIPHNVHVHALTHLHDLSPYGPCPTVSIVRGMTFILVRLPSLEVLASVSAGIKPLAQVYRPTDLDDGWQVGLTGTYYFVSEGEDTEGKISIRTRMFGSREDPATGSAASALTSYLSLVLPREKGAGPFNYHIVQGIEMGRESHILVGVSRTEDAGGITEVKLAGQAVKVMEGTLEL